jgi:SET domain-containing protein
VFANNSPIHGKGLFARQDIPENTMIVEYAGPRLPNGDAIQLALGGNPFIFRVNRRESIDGSVAWNLGRHANHSCSPNARSANVGGKIWLCSVRPILKGEEITYNYGYSFRDDPAPCACGYVSCLGIIVSRNSN